MRHLQLLSVAVLATALLPSCDGDSPVAPALPDGPVAPTSLYESSTSGLSTSERLVIRTVSELDSIWTEIFSDVATPDPVPTPDFNRDMVLVVASGEQPEACYRIKVTSAFGDGIDLTATVTEFEPTADCVCEPTPSQPVAVVSVPRSDEVNFTDVTTTECEAPV